ncbi:hypothetical protein B0H13DRAFT_1941504 [Mycena leptocephala]|nr:hypothetical protein B0H13DRAFT_1941504 [Mycena leptocephala]
MAGRFLVSLLLEAQCVSTTAGTTEFRTLLPPADYSGFRSSIIDPLCHADIGEPRPEVWTYFQGEPVRSGGFDSGFICMGFAACLQAKCSSVIWRSRRRRNGWLSPSYIQRRRCRTPSKLAGCQSSTRQVGTATAAGPRRGSSIGWCSRRGVVV